MQTILIIIFGCIGFTISSCSSKQKEAAPEVSNNVVDLKLIRYEQELFQLDTNNLEREIKILTNKYPSFSKLYFENIISLTHKSDSINADFINNVKQFLRDSQVTQLNKMVQKAYPGNDFLNKELKSSLQFMKYYFPTEKEPVFYTLISEFSYGNFIFQESRERDGIGIGLDFFLGNEFDYKKINPDNPAFSDYLNRCFNKDHLLKKTWDAWLDDRLGNPENGRLLDYIIQHGKKLYTLEKLIPEIQDSVLFEYSAKQLDWCNHNKVEIWSFFLEKNFLYSTELLKINKYINPSPISPGMPQEAPGQTGNYMGYQIIKAYMKRHPAYTLMELWKNKDAQMILNDSKFKPRND